MDLAEEKKNLCVAKISFCPVLRTTPPAQLTASHMPGFRVRLRKNCALYPLEARPFSAMLNAAEAPTGTLAISCNFATSYGRLFTFRATNLLNMQVKSLINVNAGSVGSNRSKNCNTNTNNNTNTTPAPTVERPAAYKTEPTAMCNSSSAVW